MAFPSSNSVDLSWQPIAIPAVSLLICFLGYSSQYLFLRAENLDPGPLTKNEFVTFNVLLACLWWTYYRACTTDPGRFLFPKPHSDEPQKDASQVTNNSKGDKEKPLQLPRWCKSCAAPKPARAHHCRHCGRCIPKMDHHCPWTNNCVSYTTFPSFMRFLVWTNITLAYFHCYVLWPRQAGLWHNRNLPAYLGPSMPALVHIALLSLIGGVTTFALAVMLFSTAKSWLLNTTMIEGWEISRHEAILEKQGREGGPGCATCPHPNTGSDASDFEDEHCLEPVEFPYDLGFFENMSQGMGSGNILRWFLPVFGSTTQMPVSSSSSTQPHDQAKPPYSWPENGFNDEYGMWPPLDPEKVRRDRLYGRGPEIGPATWEERRMEFEATQGRLSADEMREAFRRRQEADLIRQRQRIMTELEEVEDYDMLDDAVPADEGLAQMGVDTGISGGRELAGPRVVEIGEDEEDLPLAEVIRRRKAVGTDGLS